MDSSDYAFAPHINVPKRNCTILSVGESIDYLAREGVGIDLTSSGIPIDWMDGRMSLGFIDRTLRDNLEGIDGLNPSD